MRLLRPKEGMQIIDIGCGEGFFSRAFAEAGADVFGVDLSKELIAFATEKRAPRTRFAVASADKLTGVPDNTYDAAIIILAIQNMRDLSAVVREAARVLRKGGSFVIVLNHPAFRVPQYSGWIWDNSTNSLARRMDQYLTEREIPIAMHPGQKGSEQTLSYHRALQVYIKTLVNNGFLVAGMEEWISHKTSEPGPKADAENAARKEFPLFMMLKALKV
jgi:ubiquinone/menaquinone biosynthesis C-methylase UbiE